VALQNSPIEVGESQNISSMESSGTQKNTFESSKKKNSNSDKKQTFTEKEQNI
jgi:hypothetical protein